MFLFQSMIASMRLWLQAIPEEWINEEIKGEENRTDLQHSVSKTEVDQGTEHEAPEYTEDPLDQAEKVFDPIKEPQDYFSEYLKTEIADEAEEPSGSTTGERENPGDGINLVTLQDIRGGLVEEPEVGITPGLVKQDKVNQNVENPINSNGNSGDETEYPCEQCDKVYISFKSLERHKITHHDGLMEDVGIQQELHQEYVTQNGPNNTKENSGCEKLFPCKQCDKVYRLSTSLSRHKRKRHGKIEYDSRDGGVRYNCDQCDFSIGTKKALTRHKKDLHHTLYSCEQCDKVYKVPQSLIDHVKDIHEGVRYHCDQCDYSSGLKHTLLRHIKAHHNKERIKVRYPCDQCDQTFGAKSQLKRHKKRKHEMDVECDLCDYKGSDGNCLRQHMKFKHEGIVYPCEVCGRIYSRITDMRTHRKRVHDQVQTYSCSICTHQTKNPDYLKNHIKIVHHKIKPKSRR